MLERLQQKISPEPTQVHSFGPIPIIDFLSNIQTLNLFDYKTLHYCEWCKTHAESVGLKSLEWVYGRDIRTTLLEISSSSTLRSEHQYSNDEERLTLRKHIICSLLPRTNHYNAEVLDDPRLKKNRSLSATSIESIKKYGEYVGFLDLRSNNSKSPISLAVLSIPKLLKNDSTIKVISDNYGPAFGGPSFLSSVYCMNDVNTGGAACAQCCIVMSLGMLVNKGVIVPGTHELTFSGSNKIDGHISQSGENDCIAKVNEFKHSYATGGLSAKGIFNLLSNRVRKSRFFSNADLIQIDTVLIDTNNEHDFKEPISSGVDSVSKEVLLKLTKAYVESDYPVIVFVDPISWSKKYPSTDVVHAVVITGVRDNIPHFGGEIFENTSLVFHDPSDRPFIIRKSKSVFDSIGRAKKEILSKDRTCFTIIPVTDKMIELHLYDCIKWMRSTSGLSFHNNKALLSIYNIFIACLSQSELYTLEFSLIDPKQYLYFSRFFSPNQLKSLISFSNAIGKLSDYSDLFWTICLRSKNSGVKAIWFFDSRAKISASFLPALLTYSDEGFSLDLTSYKTMPAKSVPDSALIAKPIDVKNVILGPTSYDLSNARFKIKPSVLSSSSVLPLSQIITNVSTYTSNLHYDIMLLRPIDVHMILGKKIFAPDNSKRGSRPNNATTRFLAAANAGNDVFQWINEVLNNTKRVTEKDVFISGFATYLPWLSSLDKTLRTEAIYALVNCVKIACKLSREGVAPEIPVIEINCGSIFDRCYCTECVKNPAKQICHISYSNDKMILLLKSIHRVLGLIFSDVDFATADFKIALELEPGSTYILNSYDRLIRMHELILEDELLYRSVGFNLDIAHYRMANIHPSKLLDISDRIYHSHISDNPWRFHSKDLPLGTFSNMHSSVSDLFPFFDFLNNKCSSFSGFCSIEHEGLESIHNLYRSVTSLCHLLGSS